MAGLDRWGRTPVWSRNGQELFYWSGGQIWVASYAVQGDAFRAAEQTEVRRDTLVFITNFFDELRRIAPPATR